MVANGVFLKYKFYGIDWNFGVKFVVLPICVFEMDSKLMDEFWAAI